MSDNRSIVRFINKETASAIALFGMLLLALFLANSDFAPLYQAYIAQPMKYPVNDGLMVLFFLLVGLEIKRELVQGELSTRAQAILPLGAAAGGIIAPVAIYLYVVSAYPTLQPGWAIPAATDIAFALGVLSILGRRVPFSLKVFLTAFAIIDDVCAVLIIGFFYSGAIDYVALGGMAAVMAVMYMLGRLGVKRLWPYLLLGAVLLYATISAGLHGTIAGVLTAIFIPIAHVDARRHDCPLRHLEHLLHPWAVFGVLPLFALVNGGLVLDGLTLADITAPLPLAIMLGLFFGKQLGIFAFSYALIKLKLAQVPNGASIAQLYGVGIFGGIGFTMSQFIANLAFADPALTNAYKLGIISGSTLSALWGLLFLWLVTKKPNH